MTKQWYEERGEELTKDLRRIADALEEVLRLVKKDMEPKVRENPESIQTK
jgi:ElaB/YqjD/DUF883 family membrane-anchored ribosome-binding protein